MSTSCNMHSLDHGVSLLSLQVHPTSLNTAITLRKRRKKHTSDLSPYPTELIPFQPVNGPDTQYGQIYKPISAHPFKEAGLKGFSPLQPFKLAANLAQTNQCAAFHWPSLSELNDKNCTIPMGKQHGIHALPCRGFHIHTSCFNYRATSSCTNPYHPNRSRYPLAHSCHHQEYGSTVLCVSQYWRQQCAGMASRATHLQRLCLPLPIVYAGWPISIQVLHLPSSRLALQCG
jgi:hypothetical protein